VGLDNSVGSDFNINISADYQSRMGSNLRMRKIEALAKEGSPDPSYFQPVECQDYPNMEN